MKILSTIHQNDWLNLAEPELLDEPAVDLYERPTTGDRGGLPSSLVPNIQRPPTQAIVQPSNSLAKRLAERKKLDEELQALRAMEEKALKEKSKKMKKVGVRVRELKIQLEGTWGDNFYVGLSGLEVYDEQG